MVAMDIAVTLSPAVNRFWHIRQAYVQQGLTIPESVEDGWEQLMRIRDHAVAQLGEQHGTANV